MWHGTGSAPNATASYSWGTPVIAVADSICIQLYTSSVRSLSEFTLLIIV